MDNGQTAQESLRLISQGYMLNREKYMKMEATRKTYQYLNRNIFMPLFVFIDVHKSASYFSDIGFENDESYISLGKNLRLRIYLEIVHFKSETEVNGED